MRMGALNLSNTDEFHVDIRAKNFTMHPAYNSSPDYNDIGLIELEKPVKFNHILKPACLPSPTKDIEIPTFLTASGWGTVQYEGDVSKVLLEVNLPHVSNAACQGWAKNFTADGLKDTQLCYGGVKGEDTCQGDSGGPLQRHSAQVYCSYTLFGVTSFGDKCGLESPAIYTRVSEYLDWIEGIVWPDQGNP